jgi:hypothetical protein
MKVIFTEEYIKTCEELFGLKREEVKQSLSSADKCQIIKVDGLEISMYVKKFANYHLLTQCHLQGNDLSVDNVLRVNIDFQPSIEGMQPLDVLRELVSKYGLTLQIGNEREKFFYDKLIPVYQTSATELVKIDNPHNHKLTSSFWFKNIQKDGQNFVHCALVFCLDMDVYMRS